MGSIVGKSVLVVDDEPDVCELVQDQLEGCEVDVAHSFEEARSKLEGGTYDVVILDIMGVRGQDLLESFGKRFPCIMLTAHALTPEHLKRSVKGEARLYLPKEELPRLEVCVEKVLSTKEPLWRWLFQTVDFRRWFPQNWFEIDPDLLASVQLTTEDIEEDLRRGWR